MPIKQQYKSLPSAQQAAIKILEDGETLFNKTSAYNTMFTYDLSASQMNGVNYIVREMEVTCEAASEQVVTQNISIKVTYGGVDQNVYSLDQQYDTSFHRFSWRIPVPASDLGGVTVALKASATATNGVYTTNFKIVATVIEVKI